jgi:exopolysaccharide biosynthesis polyprenyl glycosylphosphotransferase
MDRERLAWLRLGVMLADAVALGSLWLAIVDVRSLFYGGLLHPVDPALHRPLGLLLVPLWVACLAGIGSYRALRRKSAWVVAFEVLRASGLAALLAMAAMFVLDLDWVSRTALAAFAVASVPAVVAVRELQALLLRLLRKRRFDQHRVLVVGEGPTDGLARLAAHPGWGITAVGRVPADPVLLADRLVAEPADEVFFTGPFSPRIAEIARVCDELGVPLSFDADFLGTGTRAELVEWDGQPVLTRARTHRGELELVLKRGSDALVGAIGLLVASPLILAIALAIRLDDSGSPFFGQERVGRYGRPFTMWKFRTMVPDAEARLAPLLGRNEVDGPAFKLRGDPRITRVGSILRRTSLDEIPQLWNIVRGEMSLVGPRPPLPSEVGRYERWQLRRLSMKPGLTGLWQVSGRSDLPFERWMELDLEYIDRWSLWLDLAVIARTVPAVVRGTGAR